MPADSSVATIRAAVDAIIPGDDETPPASSLGVQRHVVELAEKYLPGFSDVIAALLDAFSAGGSFAGLDIEGRHAALRAFASDENVDVRDAADALFAFTYGGMYSEWTGFDKERRVLAPPPVWSRIGYGGPAIAYPDYAESSPPPHPDFRELTL